MGTGCSGDFGNTKGSKRVHGYPTKLNAGKQGKHIPGHNNYQKGKSIFYGSMEKAQKLVDQYAGTGQWIPNSSKERVNFHQVIGRYINPATGESRETTMGTIHYSKTGTHIVPAVPEE